MKKDCFGISTGLGNIINLLQIGWFHHASETVVNEKHAEILKKSYQWVSFANAGEAHLCVCVCGGGLPGSYLFATPW